jgi:TonB family protein
VNRLIFVRSFVVTALLASGLSHAQTPDPLLLRLRRAELATTLTRDGVNPFYLKIDVQLYDAKGKPSEKGTIEEWWAGRSTEKTVFTTPSYTATQVRNGDVVLRSSGVSYPPSLLKLLLEQVIRPMPPWSQIKDSKATPHPITAGTVPLECVLLNLHDDPNGAPPDYCFDPGKDSLRITYQYGERMAVRNDVGTFQQKEVPIDVVVRVGKLIAATGHISALVSRPVPDNEVAADGLTEKIYLVPPLMMTSNLLHHQDPVYPDEAKRERITGTVVLEATIGTDGHISDLTVVSSPSFLLTNSAKLAVSGWTFKPFEVDGVPHRVETTISSHYTMSR